MVSMCIVCLTIYFVTQARHILKIMRYPPQDGRESDVHFCMYWSIIQILTACYYMVQICVTGSRTNEAVFRIVLETSFYCHLFFQCRKVLPTLMKVLPNNERERFVVKTA